MRSINFSNQPVRPLTRISAPQSRKAPTASGSVSPCVAAINAAPGVDHATLTGSRVHNDSPRLVMPMPRPSAQIHEVVCCALAPTAWAAWNTMATELVKPTSTATKPATMALSESCCRRCWIIDMDQA